MKGDLFGISVDEKLACVERELRLRKQVYPRRIAAGKMTQKLADKETALMEAVVEDYRQLVAK